LISYLSKFVFLYPQLKYFHQIGHLSIKIGLSILSILYMLVLQLFHLLFWSLTTNLGNLIIFLYVYPLVFWIFFFYFFLFSFLDFLWGQKWVTTYVYNACETKSHQDFAWWACKEKVFIRLDGWSNHLGIPKTLFFKENGLIIMGDLLLLNKFKKLVYFHGWHAFCFKKMLLLSWVTHPLKKFKK